MEFEKIFNAFTISVIVVLVLVTLISVSVVIIDKANSNLGAFASNQQSENCTQILQLYC